MLKQEDMFRVECANSISEDMIVSLLNLYQPLILGDGVLLYLTLHAEARHARKECTHKHLCTLMHIDISTLERARFRLEQFRLLRTYHKQNDKKDNYIYHLATPLTTESFLSNEIFISYFYQELGQAEANKIVERLANVGVDTNGFEEVTKPFKHTPIKNIEIPNEMIAKPIKPRYKFSDTEDILFDYERFLAKTTELKFPIEVRTKENLSLIGRMATLYGIDPDTISIFVGHCTKVTDSTYFNEDNFIRLCENHKQTSEAKVKDKYSLPPISFLQSKMNGKPVSLVEKKIIEHLSVDYKFKNDVINILLEYVLTISKNRLSKNFVDMVASEWARDGIETREQAVLETKKQLKSRGAQPRFIVEATDYNDPKYNKEVTLTKEEIEQIKKQQEEMG